MLSRYSFFGQLVDRITPAWDDFWFLPRNVRQVAYLRIVIGAFALLWLLSFSGEVDYWFGEQGIAEPQSVQRIFDDGILGESRYRWSILHWAKTPAQLSVMHLVSVACAAAFLLGLATPVSGLLTFVAIVSYIHRAPYFFGMLENVLSFSVAYLALAPSGRLFSLDHLLKRNTARHDERAKPSVRANVAVRLLQIHLSIIYLYAGLSKLMGEAWWNGEAIWWIGSQPDTALVDLTFLADHVLLMNAWTHVVVIVELLMGTVVWYRWTRPILVPISSLIWLSLIPVTGLIGYCGLMMLLNLVFLDHSEAVHEERESKPAT